MKPAGQGARVLLAVVVVLAVVAFFALDLGPWLSWETFKTRRALWLDEVNRHRVLSLLVYFLVYVAVAALSLPGATVLTLAAGALFGRWLGVGVVSLASTTGAAAAFLLSRFLLRAFVEARWGDRLGAIRRGVATDGAYYLFSLRLVPLVPFFLINAALGLSRMRLRTFWWVSQFGMLPATVLYVNAGAELGRIEAPRDVLSPTLIVALAMVGLLLLAARMVISRRANRPGRF